MWPPEAVQFLRELEDNNDTEWFRANRKRYDESLVAPARALTEQLGHLGEPRFFRPYNNRRFRPGPPLKEHLAVAIGYGSGGAYYAFAQKYAPSLARDGIRLEIVSTAGSLRSG